METEEQAQKRFKSKAVTAWGLVIVMLCGVLVTYNYMLRNRMEHRNERPAFVGKLEKDLEAVNRTGETVKLSMLRGKVWVAGYLFTECPNSCIGAAGEMVELQREFGEDERFRLVSFSVNPEGDTPEKMNAFVAAHGIDVPGWWFLTGDKTSIRDYMVSYFRFYPVSRNTDPEKIANEGQFLHDPRLALVDGNGNIRGYYNVLDPRVGDQYRKKLLHDIRWVLSESADEGASGPGEGGHGSRS